MKKRNILWTPSQSFKSASNMNKYMDWLQSKYNLTFSDYQSLWQWSVDNTEQFWLSIWEYFDVTHEGNYSKVCSSDRMPQVKWFAGAKLNYAEHIFRMRNDNRDALVFINETQCKKVSWDELEHKVKAIQSYLVSKGIKKGDRVAAYLPNIPEAIISFLAVNSLGAIWSCCSPDFGTTTVVERLEQIEPRILFVANGYTYNNKRYKRIDEIQEIVGQLPSIEDVVCVNYLENSAIVSKATYWDDIVDNFYSEELLQFTRVEFNFPIWILYSSGTTGKPKAITHSQGGVLLEHLKYMTFHNDVKEGENFFWFTTTGWMMWNFLQASLLAGATPVLFDGSPSKPSLELLWQLADELPIHHFGTSAPYLTECMKRDLPISKKYVLNSLRSIGSTGAPLPPEVFDWIYKNISSNVWLCSMSGGTDVCTAFVGGNPLLHVEKGRIQSRALGCAMYAYDDQGEKLYNSLGEMVIEKPMPSMPVYFWNDTENKRYKSSYFEKFEGKWCHGDWIKLFDDGSLIIQGRSDATLNRKGIRIGTAEIYSVLNGISGIIDAVVLNIEAPDGEDVMPLFLVLEKGMLFDNDFKTMIKNELKRQCSPRHVPDAIYLVKDIPYTLSGKKMEVPLKKLFMGMDVNKILNKDAVRNPESIEDFIKLKEKIDSSSN